MQVEFRLISAAGLPQSRGARLVPFPRCLLHSVFWLVICVRIRRSPLVARETTTVLNSAGACGSRHMAAVCVSFKFRSSEIPRILYHCSHIVAIHRLDSRFLPFYFYDCHCVSRFHIPEVDASLVHLFVELGIELIKILNEV